MATVKFKFNGHVLGKTDNALSLNMRDGDIIKVYRKQYNRG